MTRIRIAVWIAVSIAAIALGAAFAVLLVPRVRHWRPGSITIQGAVIRRDADPRREQPISGAVVTASDGVTASTARSGDSGYFELTFRRRVWPVEAMHLSVQASGYKPLDLQLQAGMRSSQNKLYVAALEPVAAPAQISAGPPQSVVSDVRIRYTSNVQAQTNIGTAVRTFQVVNRGNIPCRAQPLCSPDGVWKAAANTAGMDAGPGNEFHNARATCIAGPCPFTRISVDGPANSGRSITVTALDWSDTATFLIEAEVFHNSIDSSVRESYPVIYGRVLNFMLPASQEGVSVEAEINGVPMVFPLSPDLSLSWATCNSRSETDDEVSTTFRCELKPGYSF